MRQILQRQTSLVKRLTNAHEQQKKAFRVEFERGHELALKLARGHVAYEQNEPQLDEPDRLIVAPLASLAGSDLEAFESSPKTSIWPEVGSRAMQRALVIDHEVRLGDWVIVQDQRYRYLTCATEVGIVFRAVLSEYLACEVVWER